MAARPEARSPKPEARSPKPEARSPKPEASLPAKGRLKMGGDIVLKLKERRVELEQEIAGIDSALEIIGKYGG